jgi:hypothetical protein
MARTSKSDLPDTPSGIFLLMGLDRANQLDAARKNRRCTQGIDCAFGSSVTSADIPRPISALLPNRFYSCEATKWHDGVNH